MWLRKIVNITGQASSYGTRFPSFVRSITRLESAASQEQIVNKTQIRSFADAASDAPASAAGSDTTKPGKQKGSKQGGTSSGRPHPITQEYKTAWKKVAPLFDVPKIPTDFLDDRPGPVADGPLPTKLTVNFVLPSRAEMMNKQVDMVIVPAATGLMGVLAGHVPTIAQLRPGLLSVHEGMEVKKFFVSSGWCFVHKNSVADIVCLEAVALDQLDIEEARKGLAEYTQKQGTATTDLEKAEAQIAIEVYGALVATMSTS